MISLFPRLRATFRHRPVISASVCVAVVLGGANYFLWKERGQSAREHDDARRKGEFMLRALANRGHIDADLAALDTALFQIEHHLVEEEGMEVNLGYFYKLEKPAHVRLVRLNQLASLPVTDKGKFRTVPFSMQVSGSYRNALSFLRSLETGPRIQRIRNCTFERNSTDNSEFLLDLTVDALAKI